MEWKRITNTEPSPVEDYNGEEILVSARRGNKRYVTIAARGTEKFNDFIDAQGDDHHAYAWMELPAPAKWRKP